MSLKLSCDLNFFFFNIRTRCIDFLFIFYTTQIRTHKYLNINQSPCTLIDLNDINIEILSNRIVLYDELIVAFTIFTELR